MTENVSHSLIPHDLIEHLLGARYLVLRVEQQMKQTKPTLVELVI